MKWKIDDAMVFVDVVDHKGISAAANKRAVSKSYVSKVVGRLEEALGVRLLERNSRNIRLTDEGLALYQHCQQIVDRVEATDSMMSGLVSTPKGRLVVALPIAFSREFLAKALPDFKNRYPEIELELIVTSHPVDIIRDQIDLAVVVGVQNDSELISKPLIESRLMWVTTPEYAATLTEVVQPRDVLKHVSILETRYAKAQMPIRFHNERTTLNLAENSICVNDPLTVRESILSGGGVTLLAGQYTERLINSGELVEVFKDVELDASAAKLSIIYPSRRLISNKTRAFIDFLMDISARI
jgi:DNA-binding transcriptional LysR family regulator